MNKKYLDLQTQFTFPAHWGKLDVFSEELNLESLSLNMVGLSLPEGSVPLALGSAVAPNEIPWERAYFELLERGYLLEAERQTLTRQISQLPLLNNKGEQISFADASSVFPSTKGEQPWQFSKSNGVAIHSELPKAMKNAAFELFERDRILRFWYSRRAPQITKELTKNMPTFLNDHYEVKTFIFEEPQDLKYGISVIGIFGFPKNLSNPLLMGFGANETRALAAEKALSEVYQRLAFLWEEPTLDQLPYPAPTPQYHLDYYHSPIAWPYLHDWLNGNLTSMELGFREPMWTDLTFADLMAANSEKNKNKLFLVKAIAEPSIPLTFGSGNPKLPLPIVGQNAIHPIA